MRGRSIRHGIEARIAAHRVVWPRFGRELLLHSRHFSVHAVVPEGLPETTPQTTNVGPSVPRLHEERRRVVAAAALERYPAHLGELIDAGAPAVAAEAAPPNPAERHVRLVVDRAVVDVCHAGIEAPRDRETSLFVARDDARGEAVLGVVR